MNRQKFIETISIDEEGHYPFSMMVEDQKSELTICALALNSVHLVYAEVKKCLMENPKKIYFTLDIPASKDIKTDFVAVYFKENGNDWESVIIPYDAEGNRLEQITGGEMFDLLLKQCKDYCRPIVKIVHKGSVN